MGPVLKLVGRNIAATKGRLILMILSIVLGVSFVSGSFLLADSLRAVFDDISNQIFQGVDVQVRGVESELATGEDQARFSDEFIDDINALPEVEFAEGGLFAFESIYTVGDDGEVIRPQGPPVLASSWAGPSPVSSWTLIDGSAPGPGQIAVDEAQARAGDISIGDVVPVVGPGSTAPTDFEVVGLVRFGEVDAGSASAYFNLFDLPTMQALMEAPGVVDGIAINAADGVSNAQVTSAVDEVLGFDEGLEIVSGETLIEEQSSEFGEFIDIIGFVLLGFAIVVLFVSIFIIYNTFAILIGQRVRQFGLLRSIGMTGSQLRSMVLIEALIIGVIASVLGLFGGIGIAEGLNQLFAAASGGDGFPEGPIIFRTRTIVTVFVLGIGVTVASALIPAWLAQRIPALSALRDGMAAGQGSRTKRVAFGAVVFGLGVLLTMLGLFGSLDVTPRLSALGVGSALLFIGVAMLSVLFASAVTRFIGAPVEAARGLTGRLGRDNASRNPQRTAATATALMIGLALITGVAVLTASVQATFNRILDETIAADLFIFEEAQGLPFASTSVDQLNADPSIGQAAGVSTLRAFVDGEARGVSGFDVATESNVLNLQLSEGSYATGDSGVLVFQDTAEELALGVGDTVNVEFEDEFNADFSITGIFDDNTLVGNDWVFDRAVTDAHTSAPTVDFIGATIASGVDPAAGQAAAEAAISNFPQLSVQDNTEFKEGQEAQINQIQTLIFGLLFLCIVVAFIGIVNTMALSILERTREIGLLRAVGTTRNQLRSMVRWEAVIVSVFGALLGVVLGLVIGYAAVTAIPDSFISEISIPWGSAVVFVIIGGILGVLAAIFPARRAAKMFVLDAISTI